MSFARPDLLWLAFALPVALALAVRLYARRRRRIAEALGGGPLARRLGAAGLQRFPWLRLGLLALAGAALGMAAAGPRWGTAPADGPSRAISVVLALDVSKSMLATDVAPSRLERERLFTRRLLRDFAGDRFGLIAFAGGAYVLSPLTVDHGALELFLDALDPEIASEGGSSLAGALAQAVALAVGRDGTIRGAAIVLITDGEALEEEGTVLEMAERARRAGVIVHTVGVGTRNGAPVPERDPASGVVTGYKRDLDGQPVVSRLNEDLLRRVAERTSGEYVRLGEAGATERLGGALRRLQRTRIEGGGGLAGKEQYHWFVAAALALLCLEWLLAQRESRPAAAREQELLPESELGRVA